MTELATQAWHLLRQTGAGFMRDKVPKLSASLAYYTIFSLGPMLMVVVFVSGFFWRTKALESRLFGQIQSLIGPASATQIQEIMQQTALDGNNTLRASIGLITLLIAATSVFTEIQDSINSIWQLKIRPDAGWLKLLRTRLVSFALVIGLGFLLLVSLVLNALAAGLLDKLQAYFPHVTFVLVYAADLVINLLLTAGLFAIIYKVLPDARIRWKDVGVGAVFTAILFMVGRFGITYYIRSSSLDSAYGTAGSLVVLLVWVYYSSLILYAGAEFTKCYTVTYGAEIQADKYAMVVQTVQVESKHGSVQVNEQSRKHTERELQKAKDALDAALAPNGG